MASHHTLAALLIAVVFAAACTDDSGNSSPTGTAGTTATTAVPQPTSPTTSSPAPPSPTMTPPPEPGPVAPGSAETVAADLNTPWGMAFLADGSALVTSRDTGEILRVTNDGETTSLGTVPGIEEGAEGGLLGVEIAPGGTVDDATLFVYVTTDDDNRVLRVPLTDEALGEPEVVLDGLARGPRHQGGRLILGPDDMLYVSVGDAGVPGNAQDVDSLNGKILRMTPDGDMPPDNPIEGSLVYSYGHRNVQGLAFDDDGNLWASEFGLRTWDELNLIEPGENYGWPNVEGIGEDDAFVDPQVVWPTEEASPSGIAYYRDTLFVCALEGQNLWQIPVSDGEAGEPEAFFTDEYGRLRHVAVSPERDTLWVLTNNTDGRADPPFPRDDDDRILHVTLRQSS